MQITRQFAQEIGESADVMSLEKEAQSVMKGCKVHFLTSAQRINNNYSIVGRDDNQLVKKAVEEPMRDAFDSSLNVLQVKPFQAVIFSFYLMSIKQIPRSQSVVSVVAQGKHCEAHLQIYANAPISGVRIIWKN
jgi:hypothetical protein